MSLIQVTDLTFEYEGSFAPVFEHVSFQLDTDWKLGLVGRNGKGKTTFLRLMMGQMPYQGRIEASVSFDYFPSPVERPERDTWEVLDEVTNGEAEVWRLQRELSRLQVPEDALYRPFSTLSNGEQTKVLLAALFLQEGHFLLIDEPTNHLDQEARALVSAYLKSKRGFILVSHDRAFLDGCVDHILAMNRSDIQVQRGDFSSWYANKERQDQFERTEQERLKKDIRRLQSAASQSKAWGDQVEAQKIGGVANRYQTNIGERSYLGEKSRKMQQRRKNLERRQEQAIEEKKGLLKNAEAPEALKLFPLKHHAARLVVFEEAAACCRESGEEGVILRSICRPVDLEIRQGDRIFLQGRNGCGKTSLLKLVLAAGGMSGAAMPGAGAGDGAEAGNAAEAGSMAEPVHGGDQKGRLACQGEIRLASGLILSYVSQDTSGLRGSLMDYAAACGVEPSLFFALLRKLDLSREQLERPMEYYSQGQKKKVLLARSLCQQAHLYIWDEPLNYIDLYSRIQIEELILSACPTMLLVEHDAAFGERVATKTVQIERISEQEP